MARANGFFAGIRGHLIVGFRRAWGDAWPIVQAAVAAGVAWFSTHTVLGHAQPTFAPIAAVAALSVNVGERGQRTIGIGMLVGVTTGIMVGLAGVLLLGTSPLEVALVIAGAMLVTRVLISIIGLIQAGASAAIVITVHSSAPGYERCWTPRSGAPWPCS